MLNLGPPPKHIAICVSADSILICKRNHPDGDAPRSHKMSFVSGIESVYWILDIKMDHHNY